MARERTTQSWNDKRRIYRNVVELSPITFLHRMSSENCFELSRLKYGVGEMMFVELLLWLNSIFTKVLTYLLPDIRTLDALIYGNDKQKQPYPSYLFDEGKKEWELFFRHLVRLEGKRILDIGCGDGGKTCFYATKGDSLGLDIDRFRLRTAIDFARTIEQTVRFIVGDSAHLPLKSDTFHIIFMDDVMEHLQDPLAGLKEVKRVLINGGYICITFTSYNAPSGSHLTDWIRIPWLHFLFREDLIIRALLRLSEKKPAILHEFPKLKDLAVPERLTDFVDINGMTLRRFKEVCVESELTIKLLTFYPFRNKNFGSCLAKLPPRVAELFARKIVCVLEKD